MKVALSYSATTPAVKIEQVHKYFGSLHALNGVDLTIEQGEFFALLGPNGAGKSTLINSLAGLLKPTSGKVSVMGFDTVSQYQQARMNLGVVPQELVLANRIKTHHRDFTTGWF